jgi:hypothetical protein
MTLTEIETNARNRYNASGDTNWSSDEIIQIIYQATLELTRDCGLLIEKRFRSTSVIGTGEYALPDSAVAIKRITYDGRKLKEITMREDDAITIQNQLTSDTGTPAYYYIWDRVFHLRAIPDALKTIEIHALCSEESLTSGSVLSTPELFHGSLITYVIKEMAAKDLNWTMYDRYMQMWEAEKTKILAHIRRAKRADAFQVVKSEDDLPIVTLGVV